MGVIVSLSWNKSPEIASAISNQTINENTAFSLDISSNFSDPELDPLTYSISWAPAWFSVDVNRIITGTSPDVDTSTDYNILVNASDWTSTIWQSFTLTVNNVDNITLPTFSTIPEQNITDWAWFSTTDIDLTSYFGNVQAWATWSLIWTTDWTNVTNVVAWELKLDWDALNTNKLTVDTSTWIITYSGDVDNLTTYPLKLKVVNPDLSSVTSDNVNIIVSDNG